MILSFRAAMQNASFKAPKWISFCHSKQYTKWRQFNSTFSFTFLCCSQRRHSLRVYKKASPWVSCPAQSFKSTRAEQLRKNGSCVCFVCSSKQQMQRCFTVLNQRRFHRLIVKLQLPFSNIFTFKFASLFFILQRWARGKGKGRRFSCTAATRDRKYYTHVSPFPYTRVDAPHSQLKYIQSLFPSKATARCFGTPMGKKFTLVLFWHLLA